MNERKPGRIVTFYSFKGGTGRSMGLANMAQLLTMDVTKPTVLMIDWDLEAPGLHRYFQNGLTPVSTSRYRRLSQADKTVDSHPGVIDLLNAAYSAYQKNRIIGPTPSDAGEGPPSLVVHGDATEPSLQSLRKQIRNELFSNMDSYLLRCNSDRLFLIKAGAFGGTEGSNTEGVFDTGYAEQIRRFDWEAFYRCDPDFFPAFRRYLMGRFDYVLIDSRTGLTDSSGICTKQMPEVLVLVFVPNRQNIDGLVDVVRGVKSYRYSSIDVRPLMMYPLACRLDSQYEDLRLIWRRGGKDGDFEVEGYQPRFERLFTEIYDLDTCDLTAYFDTTQIAHDGFYAYGEKIAVLRGSTTERYAMGFGFANLASRLLADKAPWEPIQELLVTAATATFEAAKPREFWLAYWTRRVFPAVVFLVVVLASTITWYRQYRVRSALRGADHALESKAYPQAIAAYARALPGAGIQGYRGRALAKLASHDVQGAVNDFTAAIAKEPNNAALLRDRAYAFKQLGNSQAALADYDRALQIQTDVATLKDRAYMYRLLGQPTKADADYEAILRIAPDDQDALLAHAYLNREAHNYDQAIQAYTAALAGHPSDASIHVERGMTYVMMGKRDLGKTDFESALALDHNNSSAQLGLLLLRQNQEIQPVKVPRRR